MLRFPEVPAVSVKPAIWNDFRISERLDVSMIDSLAGQYIKLYFFYRKPVNIQFDSLRVEINGIK